MLNVLLIDDNPAQLQVRQAVLEDAGMSVYAAMTAEAALPFLQAERAERQVDVIVTDHILPDESGAVFVRRLREMSSDCPVLAISGLSEAEQEYAGLNVHFLPKPVAPQDLIKCVRQLGADKRRQAAP